jgi:hypothetical protein
MGGEESEGEQPQPEQSSGTAPVVVDGKNETHKSEASKKISQRLWTWIKKFNEPITVVTLLLFGATVALYYATRDLVIDAHHNAELQLRAYVGVNSISPDDMAAPKGIHVNVQNSGQTPAYNVRVFLNWKLVQVGEKLPAGFDYPDVTSSDSAAEGSLAVLNGGNASKEYPFTVRVPPEVFSIISNRQRDGYFYGHVDFDDIFDEHWLTEFCYRYMAASNHEHSVVLCREHTQANRHRQN